MVDNKESHKIYARQFAEQERELARCGGAWLSPIRQAAMARFVEQGFPTTGHEEWRHTNVAPIVRTAFSPTGNGREVVTTEQINDFIFGGTGYCLLVFVNGRYAPEFSTVRTLPDGLKVGSLAKVMESDAELLKPYLARSAGYQESPFTALNTAFLKDGAFVYIPKGTVIEEPICLLFVAATSGQPRVMYPRNLIVSEANSQATIIECYVTINGGEYLTNTVTEIVAHENAVLDHYKIVRESEAAYHIACLQLHQYCNSDVRSHTYSLGGQLVRNDINTRLDGEGCNCTLSGLTMIAGDQHVDNHLWVEHARPHCTSREYFKGIYDGRSRGVFSGRIRVAKDAQKTDAKQSNMNLILSKEALAHSKPQLEIFADDVKCTHGATVGQIDEEAVFYLRSRGISEQAARSLLIYAFARESIEAIPIEPLRNQLLELILARLPQGQLFREAI